MEPPVPPINENKPLSFYGILRGCRSALMAGALFSAVINLLYLTGSFYMMQVYDRVIPSRSIPTLIGLSILAALLYFGQGLLDFFRGRLFANVAERLDDELSPRTFDVVMRGP